MNLDQLFRSRFRLKKFLIHRSSSPFVRPKKTVCVIVEEGILSIFLWNYFVFGAGLRRCCLNIFFIYSSGCNFVGRSRTICTCNSPPGHYENIFVKLIFSWTSGSGRNIVLRCFLSTALVAIVFGGYWTIYFGRTFL